MKSKTANDMIGGVRDLIPDAPFESRGLRLGVLVPLGRILRGLYFENSSIAERCYVWAFIQPLYVPSTVLSFNMGKRVGGPSRTWAPDEVPALVEAVRIEALPWIGPFQSPTAVVESSELSSSHNLHVREAIAYSLIASEELRSGIDRLEALCDALTDTVPWQLEMLGRARELCRMAKADPTEAMARLLAWQSSTIEALDL